MGWDPPGVMSELLREARGGWPSEARPVRRVARDRSEAKPVGCRPPAQAPQAPKPGGTPRSSALRARPSKKAPEISPMWRGKRQLQSLRPAEEVIHLLLELGEQSVYSGFLCEGLVPRCTRFLRRWRDSSPELGPRQRLRCRREGGEPGQERAVLRQRTVRRPCGVRSCAVNRGGVPRGAAVMWTSDSAPSEARRAR